VAGREDHELGNDDENKRRKQKGGGNQGGPWSFLVINLSI
jgi:hypothetical protein